MSYKYHINEKYLSMKDDILDVEKIFLASDKTIHKARNELKIISIEQTSTVIKAFKIPHLLNQIVYAYFRGSKAKRSYEYSFKIQQFTPEPIGYIEFYRFGLLKTSYFISEEFKYDFTIKIPLFDKTHPDRDEIIKAFARFTLELHNNGIYHNDYSPGNILVKKENENYIFKIVDINRMKFFSLSQNDRAQNFSQLWADEDTLKTIAIEYASHYDVSDSFSDDMLDFTIKNKEMKNLKNKLKGKKDA